MYFLDYSSYTVSGTSAVLKFKKHDYDMFLEQDYLNINSFVSSKIIPIKLKEGRLEHYCLYILEDENDNKFIIPSICNYTLNMSIGALLPVRVYENVKSSIVGKVYYFPDHKFYTAKKVTVGKGTIIAVFEGENGDIEKPIYYMGKGHFTGHYGENFYDFYKNEDIDFIKIADNYDHSIAYSKFSLDSVIYEYNKEKEAKEAANLKKKEQKKAELISKYGEEFGAKIASGDIVVGMTKEMCKVAKGSPDNARVLNGGVDVWIYSFEYQYSHGLLPIIQVTFKDGKVTDVLELAEYPF